ncbi:MAG: ATP-binding protein [Candidatus Margulisiibacteriota bacterium]
MQQLIIASFALIAFTFLFSLHLIKRSRLSIFTALIAFHVLLGYLPFFMPEISLHRPLSVWGGCFLAVAGILFYIQQQRLHSKSAVDWPFNVRSFASAFNWFGFVFPVLLIGLAFLLTPYYYNLLVILIMPVVLGGQLLLMVSYQKLFLVSELTYFFYSMLFRAPYFILVFGLIRIFQIASPTSYTSLKLLFLFMAGIAAFSFLRTYIDLFLTTKKQQLFESDILFFDELAQALANAKSMTHILNGFKQFSANFDNVRFFSDLNVVSNTEELETTMTPNLNYYHDRFAQSSQSVRLVYLKDVTEVHLKLSRDDHQFGWLVFQFPTYWDLWLIQHKFRFKQLFNETINAIVLVRSYNQVNTKIKHMANANEFVSRLSLSSMNNMSHEILVQYQQIIGFQHLILPPLPKLSNFSAIATVYVPKHLRDILAEVSIDHLIQFPFDPVCFSVDDPKLPDGLKTVAGFYQAKQCYLMPIVNEEKMVGFYVAFSNEFKSRVDLSLVSIINKQISSLIYRSISNKKIELTKRFHQEIIDYLSSIIIVLDAEFNIKFTNKYFIEFFKKSYTNFHELIMDYPALDVVHKIVDFSDTELTLNFNQHHFKLSLRKVDRDSIIVLLSNVTDLIKIQHTISKSSKLKGMGTFVAGVAHEIKNPLVAVKTFTQLLSKDWSNHDIREKCSQIVLPQLHRIEKLSKSLNFFGKNETASFEPTNLSKLILDAESLLKAEQRYNQATSLTLDIEEHVMVFANETKLNQVILNLFLNALDAVEHVPEPQVILDIEDNGTGIPEKDQPYLFDPFFTTKDHGTGLGLSIVHQIILDHQGSISLLKSNDSGTVFRIAFPKLLRPKLSGVLTEQ